jgi:hypothetical protein
MRTSFSPRQLVRFLLAILFAACATTYSALWIIHNQLSKPQPGFTNYHYHQGAEWSVQIADADDELNVVLNSDRIEHIGLRIALH